MKTQNIVPVDRDMGSTDEQSNLEAPRNKPRIASYLTLALLSFFACDNFLRFTFHPSPYLSPNRSFAYWATKDLLSLGKPPDIVLMGSSLMLAVLNDGDATYLGSNVDALSHHRSKYFEHLLENKSGKPVTTASLAIGGQMASDVYALGSTLLTGNQKPKEVVWGIAPRDLVDFSFQNPYASETLRYMNHIAAERQAASPLATFEQPADVLADSKPKRNFWNALETGLGQLSFIYGHRQELVASVQNAWKDVLSKLRGGEDLETAKVPTDLLHLAMKELPEDYGTGTWLVTPYVTGANNFRDTTAEYRRRYNPFSPKVFNTQSGYLEKFLSLCSKEKIRVTLVNMPLTKDNMQLMPSGVYPQYLAKVTELSKKYNANLVDFNQKPQFKKELFADSIHLNGAGGMLFWEQLAEQMKSNEVAATQALITN